MTPRTAGQLGRLGARDVVSEEVVGALARGQTRGRVEVLRQLCDRFLVRIGERRRGGFSRQVQPDLPGSVTAERGGSS
jgi:hypothetical protein